MPMIMISTHDYEVLGRYPPRLSSVLSVFPAHGLIQVGTASILIFPHPEISTVVEEYLTHFDHN